jgi:hypothetical protein
MCYNQAVVAGFAAAPEGILVLRDEASLFIYILKPLIGHVIDLPSGEDTRAWPWSQGHV